MKSDFEVITHHFQQGESIKILPISDVHIGSAEYLQKEFEKFCETVINEQNTYIVLNGDLLDNALKNSKSDSYLASMPPYKAKDYLAGLLKPLADKGKILCCTEGNHEQRTIRETSDYPGYDIMCRLGLEDVYRPNACYLAIKFDKTDKDYRIDGRTRPVYTFCVTHGAGSTLKRFEDFGGVSNCDILIVGHTHKPIIAGNSRLVIDTRNGKVTEAPFGVVVAGSWLSYGGYALQKMYKPTAKALETINLCGTHKEISMTMKI